MISSRRMALAGGALAMTLALPACGGAPDDDPPELTVWIMDPGSVAVEEILDQAARTFEAQHDGLSVTVEYVSWTQAYDRFVTATDASHLPDLAEMTTSWTPEFAAAGVLAPVPPVDGVEFVPALVEAGTVGGANYGYPWYAGARALVYRTDVLDAVDAEPPRSWDEILSVGARIADADLGLAPIHVAGEYSHWFIPLIWGAGGEIASEQDGAWSAGVDSTAGRSAFAHYHELWQAGWTPEAGLGWTSWEVRDAFAAEQSAMMIAAGWDLAEVLDRNPDLADRVGVALMPAGPAGRHDAFAGGSHLVVAEGSAQRDLAHEFAQFLISPQRAASLTEQIGFLPGTVEGVQAAVGDDDLHRTFGTQLVEHSRPYPATVWWNQIESDRVFVEAMQRLLRGEQSVDEAVAAVDDAIRTAAG